MLTFPAWVKNVKEHLVLWVMKMWCIYTMFRYTEIENYNICEKTLGRTGDHYVKQNKLVSQT